MFLLLINLLAQAQFVGCGCLCVDGVAKTLCQTIVEAQQQSNVCSPRIRCPVAEATDPDDPEPDYFDAPGEPAHSCREVRIWDDELGAYTGVKICDVYTGGWSPGEGAAD